MSSFPSWISLIDVDLGGVSACCAVEKEGKYGLFPSTSSWNNTRKGPLNPSRFNSYLGSLLNGSYGRYEETSDAMIGMYKDDGNAVPEMMDNLASLMIHALRKRCLGRNETNQLTGRQSLNGTVWTSATLVHVRWPWLIFPLVVEILGIAFFVAILFKSRFSDAEL